MTPRLVFEDDAPEPEDELTALLQQLQLAVLCHPVAAQAAFRSLVAEGRRFSQTDAGAAWAARLEGSPLVTRGRLAWEALTLNALDDDEAVAVPTAVLDAFTQAVGSADMELLLSAAIAEGAR